ncbi:glycosyltransferase family 2 protein [Actinotalea sp. Marseille-Q4924]|uniref:glycosyltransferase family 2 protein n=1 Tax=Actinotalea sp. Marseille-Q4924 TaxID=2866571 RepID=UPI001CE473BA|nr:glycosyltransferase family 2 protein [Actinotalea sp. Marseille-Q4924]
MAPVLGGTPMVRACGNVLKSVSVVIPTRNESRNIGWVLDRLPDFIDEVILVDGGSVDDTVEVALRHRPDIIVAHQARRGKGNALARGFELATSDLIVMIDADGSMAPAEIEAFVDALLAGADYAKGSRFTAGGGSDDITVLRRAGNRFLNGLTNALFGSDYSDLCYGYNAFSRECVAAFALPDATTPGEAVWGDGFEIETMINIRVVLAGARVVEVPSYEAERRFGESNLNTFRDGVRVLRTIFDERFGPQRAGSLRPVPQPAATQPSMLDLAPPFASMPTPEPA